MAFPLKFVFNRSLGHECNIQVFIPVILHVLKKLLLPCFWFVIFRVIQVVVYDKRYNDILCLRVSFTSVSAKGKTWSNGSSKKTCARLVKFCCIICCCRITAHKKKNELQPKGYNTVHTKVLTHYFDNVSKFEEF